MVGEGLRLPGSDPSISTPEAPLPAFSLDASTSPRKWVRVASPVGTPLALDLTIIGNGAIGCALALRFAQAHKDMRIGLVGSARRPGCASLAAGAMLNVFAELEAGALDYPSAKIKFEAAVAASQLWDDHLARLNSKLRHVAPVTINQGTYVVSNACTDKFDDENFEAIIGYLREYRQVFREVHPREIEGIKPAPQARPLRAIMIENEGTVSAKHLHRAYDEVLSAMPNVTVVDDEVESIDTDGDTKTLKTRDGRLLSSPSVIIAAGVKTQDFVNQLGLAKKIPRLVYGAGVSLILKCASEIPKKVLRTPNRGLACGVYLVPYDDNHCYVGATNYVCPWEVSLPRVQAVHYLLEAAMAQVNTDFYKAEIVKTIVGYRPTTLDTFPLFGQTSVPGVWIASGTKRDGFHLSPKIAEEFLGAFATGEQPFGGAFKPERSLILEVPREAAIERSVAHIISTGYQHGFRAPHSNWDPLLQDGIRRKVIDAYERSGLKDYKFGIPPEMLDMFRYGHAQGNIETLFDDKDSR